jgi:hypothetical protein
MRSLPLQFGEVTITVTSIPDNLEITAVEKAARAVIERGVHPYPVGGRVDWRALVYKGLVNEVLRNA